MNISNTHNKSLIVFLTIITLLAAVVYTMNIENRPLHGDEAVNAFKYAQLRHNNHFKYNPHEYHGPSLYYLTHPVMLLNGFPAYPDTTVGMFRFVPALFALGTLLLLYPLRLALGSKTTIFTAVIFISSSAMTFYARYYIHEYLLIFFTMLCFVGIWIHARKPTGYSLTLIGVSLAMMHTTKETCIIAWFAIFVGLIYLKLARRHKIPEDDSVPSLIHLSLPIKHLVIIFGIAIPISIIFFSSFFTNASGPIDSILTYERYFNRASGEGSYGLHDKPWYHYLRILTFSKSGPGPWFSEVSILILAGIGLITAWLPRTSIEGDGYFAKFISIFTVIMVLVYSAIAYKTPWCILGMLHGLILLAGVGACYVWNAAQSHLPRLVLRVMLVMMISFLAFKSYHANFKFPYDRRNPYVYSNPQKSILDIPKQLKKIASLSPDKLDTPVLIIGADNWPLPYYLRQFTNLQLIPPHPDEIKTYPIIIVDPSEPLAQSLRSSLKTTHTLQYKSLRPRQRRTIYIRQDLWKQFLQAQKSLQ